MSVRNWVLYGVDTNRDYLFVVDGEYGRYPVYVDEAFFNQTMKWYLGSGAGVDVYDLSSYRDVKLV